MRRQPQGDAGQQSPLVVVGADPESVEVRDDVEVTRHVHLVEVTAYRLERSSPHILGESSDVLDEFVEQLERDDLVSGVRESS